MTFHEPGQIPMTFQAWKTKNLKFHDVPVFLNFNSFKKTVLNSLQHNKTTSTNLYRFPQQLEYQV